MLPNHALISGTFGATFSKTLLTTKRSSSASPPLAKKNKSAFDAAPKSPAVLVEKSMLAWMTPPTLLPKSLLPEPLLPLVTDKDGRISTKPPYERPKDPMRLDAARILKYPTGEADPVYQQALAAAIEGGGGPPCYRCKRGPDKCGGSAVCVLTSNVFTAKKTLKCRGCLRPTRADIDLVTKMTSGSHAGNYLHLNCALMWHETHAGEAAVPYKEPCEQIKEFALDFVSGKHAVARLQMTAGGGKTNMLVYLVHMLRERGISFIVLVYNVAAKEELLARGLVPQEVLNFHSFLYRAYRAFISATLSEALIMTQERTSAARDVKPVVCDIKVRLLVVLHFSREPLHVGRTLTNLYKAFVQGLADIARTKGFGCAGKPACTDVGALLALVETYSLARRLDGAFNALSQPDKMTLARKVGVDPADPGFKAALIEHGVNVAASVLELSFQAATSTELNGSSFLRNHATNKNMTFPVIDSVDMQYVPTRLQLAYPTTSVTLVDEAHDLDSCQGLTLEAMTRDGTKLVTVDDDGQYMYGWRGVDRDTHLSLMAGAHHLLLANNYRNARSIVTLAQSVYDEIPILMTIRPMVDLEGVVAEDANFFSFPLAYERRSVMIIGRTFSHVFQLYMILVGMGVPAKMHGQPETASQLKALHDEINEHLGTLARVRAALLERVASNAPSANSIDYDLHVGLLELMKVFERREPLPALDLPETTAAFVTFLYDFFAPTATVSGVVRMGTIHWSKGLEADDVYIVQPRLLPLPERIALGGWERYEELCVQFVAYTRARERLILLSHLDDFNRQNLLHLWDEPVPCSQEPSQEAAADESDESDADELDDASVQAALLLLELTALPVSQAALNMAFKSVIRKAHPDRNFGSAAATERSAALLAARATIKKALHAA